MCFLRPRGLISFLAALLPALPAPAENVLVMGDSLTKEYRSEFVVLYPDRPAAWGARNWIEILDDRRSAHFDLGSWSVFPDSRLTGHEYNWAKPGGTAREFRNFLRRTPDAEQEIRASSGGDFLWEASLEWRNTFGKAIPQVERIIIFYGANDLAMGNTDPVANPVVDGSPKQIDYESIYDGSFGPASNPDALRTSIRTNLKSIIDYFRNPRTNSNGDFVPPRFAGPMILCAVPHVGSTPKVQADAGTDPVRTAVLTQMIEGLNNDLSEFALAKDVGFANIYPVTKAILDPGDFQIGGITFFKEADPDCRPRYLFSGDGFHPNTPVHAKVAQVVADAFLNKYPEMDSTMNRLSDREIISGVLGLPIDTGYQEWLTAAGVSAGNRDPLADPDNDGLPNVMEYALAGRNPGQKESAPAVEVERGLNPQGPGEVLTVRWRPRFPENAYLDLVPQFSLQLNQWEPVPTWLPETLPDGRQQVVFKLDERDEVFFRLSAVVAD